MKKTILFAGLVTLITVTACNSSDNTSKTDNKQTEQTAEVYTCPMHPEVVADKPGKCPKCNMDLVKKEK